MLNLINLKQVTKKDFEIRESGEVRMSDDARKSVVECISKTETRRNNSSVSDEKMTIGLLPHVQAQLLARYIRGDIPAYPPFYLK